MKKMELIISIDYFNCMKRIYFIIILLPFYERALPQKIDNIINIDTIPLTEIVSHFSQGKKPLHHLNYYDLIEGISETNISRLITSPFLIKHIDIPTTNCHAIWEKHYSQLLLKKILPIGMSEARAEEIFSMLLKKYGGSREKGIFASWFTGVLNALICPYDLFGEWVSKEKTILTVDKGYITSIDPCGIPRGSLNNCGYGVYIYDNCWNKHLTEIKCLEKFIIENYSPVFTLFQRKYSLLLFTDLSGKSYLHVLKPKTDGWFDKKVISELKKTINKLPIGSFRYLETLDGRIFQGRYLKATYSYQDGWSISDYIH